MESSSHRNRASGSGIFSLEDAGRVHCPRTTLDHPSCIWGSCVDTGVEEPHMYGRSQVHRQCLMWRTLRREDDQESSPSSWAYIYLRNEVVPRVIHLASSRLSQPSPCISFPWSPLLLWVFSPPITCFPISMACSSLPFATFPAPSQLASADSTISRRCTAADGSISTSSSTANTKLPS